MYLSTSLFDNVTDHFYQQKQIVKMSTELKASSFEENISLKIMTWASLFRGPLAFHLRTETLVPIQILRGGKCTDSLISSDTELLKSLHHSHIKQLLQVIETSMKPYLVMEEGAKLTLLKHVTKCGYLEEEGRLHMYYLGNCLCLTFTYPPCFQVS